MVDQRLRARCANELVLLLTGGTIANADVLMMMKNMSAAGNCILFKMCTNSALIVEKHFACINWNYVPLCLPHV